MPEQDQPVEDLHDMIVQCAADGLRYFPESAADLVVHTLGLCGESGEFADIVKKISRGTISVADARNAMAMELIDVQIYLCNLYALLKIDPFEVYNIKRSYNNERFENEAETDSAGHVRPIDPRSN